MTIQTLPNIQAYPTASFLAYPFRRVCSHPLHHFSHASHSTMFLWWQLCHSFPATQWLPAPPVSCPYHMHWCKCTSFGLVTPSLFFFFLEEEGVGKALIPIQPFLGISMISNSSISLVTLLLHGSPSPTFTGMGDQGTLPAHHPTESGILPPGLSLASLVSSLSPFNSSLKPFQWVLLTPEQRSSSPLETDESCLLPAGLALHKMTRDQKKN